MNKARYVIFDDKMRATATNVLSRLPLDPVYEVTIQEYRESRSIEQNRRYWALLTTIANEMPKQMDGEYHDPETWHELFKSRFIGRDTIVVDGEPFLVDRPSRKLNVMQFMEYSAEVEMWAVEHNIFFTQ